MSCAWCLDPQSEVETGLCNMHEAERLGLTQAQLEEMLMEEREVG